MCQFKAKNVELAQNGFGHYQYTQRRMLLFSQGLSAKVCNDEQWGQQPAAEASEHELKAAEEAAFSRLR
jgi:hypothetical protein